MKLLVVRHAIAMDRAEYQAQAHKNGGVVSKTAAKTGDALASDDDRPLTLDGLRKMRKNAKGLRELVDMPDLLVSSPLTRARQTAEVLCEAWRGLEHSTIDSLRPGSEPEEFAEWLAARHGFVSIVGHDPHLSVLVSWFLAGGHKSFLQLKKGGACLLEFPRSFGKGRGELLWLATPNFLRASRD